MKLFINTEHLFTMTFFQYKPLKFASNIKINWLHYEKRLLKLVRSKQQAIIL